MPNAKCAAAFCHNRRTEVRKRKLAIIFHAFPGDEELRCKWIAFCRRGKDWTPFKTDAICSVHFRDDDYQMAHSPLVKWSKNLRRLHVNAYPSVQDGSVVTVSKKQKLEEQARQQRLEELYRQNNPLAEPSTEFDHTYSGVTVKEEPDESPVLEKIVYRLQEFPNLCALCFRAIDDEKLFAPFVSYSESLESTIEQKYDEITGEVINQKEHASIHHLLPDKVCAECLEVLIQFHHYQRQLQCLKKFSAGMAQLLKGDRQPLAELYATQGDYLVNILKNLNICNESEDNVTLERLEAEVATYGRVKKCIVFEQDHPSDTSAVVHQCEEVGPNTSVAIIPASSFRIDSSIASSGETNQLIRTHTKDGDVTSKSKKWICPYDEICREWFLDEPSLQQHMNNDHKIFKCRTCGYKVKFYDLFKKHIQSHDIARALLLSHNNTGSNKQRKCEKCGRLFRSERLLLRHKKTHVGGESLICKKCFGVYVSERWFNNHKCCSSNRTKVKQHERNDTDQFEAMDEETQFGYESELEEKLASHSNETNEVPLSKTVTHVEFLSIEIL